MNWTEMNKLENPTQEEWFDMWCAELIEAGYIEKVLDQNIAGWRVYDGETIEYFEYKILFKGTPREKKKQIKKKYVLHRPVDYTPDRVIFWTSKAKDVFYTDLEDFTPLNVAYFLAQDAGPNTISVLDVKSPFGGKNSSDVSFSIKKKWVWAKERVYINQAVMHPIRPLKNVTKYLWATTFTPKRFLFTDKLSVTKNKPIPYRTIPNKKGVPNWEVRGLEDFLKLKSPNN